VLYVVLPSCQMCDDPQICYELSRQTANTLTECRTNNNAALLFSLHLSFFACQYLPVAV